jgi:transcriptional regulator with XRE-family HTH domain
MWKMTPPNRLSVDSPRISNLGPELSDPGFREAYFTSQLKTFLADQIRALRGDRAQAEFGRIIGKPQSVVSRLENETYGQLSLQTLIDIANKLDIALLVRFVDWPAFLRLTSDYSAAAIAPPSFDYAEIEQLVREEERKARTLKLQEIFKPMDQQQESSALPSPPPSPSGGAELVWLESQRRQQEPQQERDKLRRSAS